MEKQTTILILLYFLFSEINIILAETIENLQYNTQNYIVTVTPLDATQTAEINGTIIQLGHKARALTEIQYFDGLGRPSQTIQKGITPDGNDLVILQEYDGFGRSSNTWLPIPSETNGNFVSPSTLKSSANTYYNDTRPYFSPIYENSPLNLITGEYGPGDNWSSHPINKKYEINNTTDSERICRYYYMSDETHLRKQGNYANNQLFIIYHIDEDGKSTLEFRNKLDQILLIRQLDNDNFIDTYYIYDDFGNLCFVLPPSATDALSADNIWSVNSDAISSYGYFYRYDERNRCIEKKMPGADPIYVVYDRADHPVLIQDGNLRTKNEWLFTKYDALGREIVTGLLTSDYSHNDFIEICRDTLVVEEFTFNYEMPIIGYTNRIKLGNNIRVLTINYYDNYQFRNLNDYQNIFLSTGPVSNNKEIYQNCQGLITATYIGQTDNMNRYEISSFYYDTQERIVEKLVEVNGFGPHNHIYIEYDFAGNPINIKKEHVALNYEGKQTQIYTYQYDHAGRITSESLKFNTLKEKKIHEYLYNDLGQVSQKFLHDRSDTITYTYNLRGWPISIINRAFSQQLYYEEALVPQSTRYFNGNISAVKYSQGGREYSFHMTYDALDRIISSQSSLNGKMANDLEEFNFDKMGNIKNIVRKKNNIYTHQLAFEHKGNQLTDAIDLTDTDVPLLEINTENSDEPSNYSAIPDDSQEIISGKKIRDPVFGENLLSSTSNDDIPYAYDKNGNMSRNTGKNIENIIYNHLNLPQSVEFGNNDQIANHYMADGRRVISAYTSEAKIDDSGILQPQTITTDCLWGEYIYRNYKISMIKIPGGYIQVDNTKSDPEQKYTFVRYIYDHLGNVRITADNSGILQSTEYYPSGYFFNRTGTGSQPYLLGEKEYINMFGLNQYDFGARTFDPYFLRWSTPDPLQEKYYSISPYAYCNNNPILYIDPDGRDWYKDQDSTIQYSPEINRNSRLADGQRYLGQTYTESVNGKSIADYRKDGSILFYREREAYRRMINQTVKTGNESMAILMSDKVLVLPDYQNTPNEVNLKSYHYSAKGGNIIDADKNTWPTIATAHTHPNGTPPSDKDNLFSINITPYKPVYVLQMKGNNSISAVTGRPIENGTLTDYITQMFPEFHLNNLIRGKCSLIETTKSIDFKTRVINAKRLW